MIQARLAQAHGEIHEARHTIRPLCIDGAVGGIAGGRAAQRDDLPAAMKTILLRVGALADRSAASS